MVPTPGRLTDALVTRRPGHFLARLHQMRKEFLFVGVSVDQEIAIEGPGSNSNAGTDFGEPILYVKILCST